MKSKNTPREGVLENSACQSGSSLRGRRPRDGGHNHPPVGRRRYLEVSRSPESMFLRFVRPIYRRTPAPALGKRCQGHPGGTLWSALAPQLPVGSAETILPKTAAMRFTRFIRDIIGSLSVSRRCLLLEEARQQRTPGGHESCTSAAYPSAAWSKRPSYDVRISGVLRSREQTASVRLTPPGESK